MSKRNAELVTLPENFVVPQKNHPVVFYEDLVLRPRGKESVVIESGTTGYSFFKSGKVHIWIPGFHLLLVMHHFNAYSRLNDVELPAVNIVSFERLTPSSHLISSSMEWEKTFDMDTPYAISMAKIYWTILNADKQSLSVPKLETLFKSLLGFCEQNELYEQCQKLMNWLDCYRRVHSAEFEKNPILNFCKGYGWLTSSRRIIDPQLH